MYVLFVLIVFIFIVWPDGHPRTLDEVRDADEIERREREDYLDLCIDVMPLVYEQLIRRDVGAISRDTLLTEMITLLEPHEQLHITAMEQAVDAFMRGKESTL